MKVINTAEYATKPEKLFAEWQKTAFTTTNWRESENSSDQNDEGDATNTVVHIKMGIHHRTLQSSRRYYYYYYYHHHHHLLYAGYLYLYS